MNWPVNQIGHKVNLYFTLIKQWKLQILDSDSRNTYGKPIMSLVFLWLCTGNSHTSDSLGGDSSILKYKDMVKPDYEMLRIL